MTPKPKPTDAEERDGFVEYCKMRSCERMEVERADDLDGVEDEGMDKLRVIAIESKLEWRGFTDEMKMFWIERGNFKSTLNSWNTFMKDNNYSIPSVYATGPVRTPDKTDLHDH
ncbi:hypothetical protein BGZ76_002547 [Entomortierella beljakovae]|nr:hypothetical protein BGZ76_002547 [Entomortierella beljakovae]